MGVFRIFSVLGLGEVWTGYAWNVHSEGKDVEVFPTGQSSRRDHC